MRKQLPVATLLWLILVPIQSPHAADQVISNASPRETLLETVKALDAGLFDAYNRCDLDKLAGYVAEDLEFYHDQTGLSRGRQLFLEAIQKNICGKVHRDLLAGSLEVYPLNGYGAVEIGSHLFCNSRQKTTCDPKSDGIAQFVMLWQQQAGTWKLTRVISYNHVAK